MLFLLSGFCGLLYQVVWLRIAMAEFGVTSSVISVVLSVFMLGLGLGAWLGGRLSAALPMGVSPLVPYALVELAIGAGGLAVPFLLRSTGETLVGALPANSASSLTFSALAILVSVLPFTTLMGLTFPLVMSFLKKQWNNSEDGFSFLYLPNVIGAAAGTLLTAYVLIELNGFQGTLWVGAQLNALVALLALACTQIRNAGEASNNAPPSLIISQRAPLGTLIILFLSGFISMALEVLWNRMFSSRLGNSVYAFAIVLAIYLLATAAGTIAYRRITKRAPGFDFLRIYPLLAPFTLLGLLSSDPFHNWILFCIFLSIIPVSFLLGALTPAMLDRYSLGDAKRGGFAYAVNVGGCILGPLACAYLLLPFSGENSSLILLSLAPMLGYPFFARKFPRWIFVSAAMVALIFIGNSFIPKWTESRYGSSVATLSDNTATVSVFSKGRDSYLTVNHISMTSLTTITKMMVHFPLLLREKPPESILVICFGMGTTFRSALSWGVPTYAVELVPSVPKMFSHFHPDAAKSLNDPNGRIVIDDGRRFLKHVQEKFDLITLDPPPPFDSAASGMLYSTEFYEEAKQKLKPGGLLQQWWYTSEDSWLIEAAIRSAVKVFPYVMIFPSVEGWGYHILGSNDPIMVPSIATALARLPAAAARDMTEWEAGSTPEKVIGKMLNRGLRPMEIPGFSATGPLITDDLPLNEYYFLRKSR